MGNVNDFVAQHWLALLVAYWAYSAAVSSMPRAKSPDEGGNPFYYWFWGFNHAIAGSVGALVKDRFPKAEQVIEQVDKSMDGTVTTKVTTSVPVPKPEQASESGQNAPK